MPTTLSTEHLLIIGMITAVVGVIGYYYLYLSPQRRAIRKKLYPLQVIIWTPFSVFLGLFRHSQEYYTIMQSPADAPSDTQQEEKS